MGNAGCMSSTVGFRFWGISGGGFWRALGLGLGVSDMSSLGG